MFSLAKALAAASNNIVAPVDTTDNSNIGFDKGWSVLGSIEPSWGIALNASSNENVKSIAVDPSYNVYVGTEYTGTMNPFNVNSGTSSAYTVPVTASNSVGTALIRYNSIGNPTLVAGISGVGSNATTINTVIANANWIHLSGTYSNGTPSIYNTSGTSTVLASTILFNSNNMNTSAAYVVKYNTSGIAQWTTSAFGAGQTIGSACVIDSQSNVYMAGKYTSNAPVVYNSNRVVGNTVLEEPISSSEPGFVVKYDSNGIVTYGITLNGAGAKSSVTSAAVDANNNWYVSGSYSGTPIFSSTSGGSITLPTPSSGIVAGYVAKYTSVGVPVIAMKIERVQGSLCVVVDSSGAIYVSGQYDNSGNPPLIYNASGILGSVTLPVLSTVTNQASFIVKYGADGSPLYASAVYKTIINKITLDPISEFVVAAASYKSTATFYNNDGTVSPIMTVPSGLNMNSTGMIIRYDSTLNAFDDMIIDSSVGVNLNDVKVDSQGLVYGLGSYSNVPQIYNNKGMIKNALLPNIAGGLAVKYGPSIQANYNIASLLTPSNNGFVKHITNVSTTATTLNLKRTDLTSANIIAYTLTAGSTAMFSWFDKWYKTG